MGTDSPRDPILQNTDEDARTASDNRALKQITNRGADCAKHSTGKKFSRVQNTEKLPYKHSEPTAELRRGLANKSHTVPECRKWKDYDVAP